MKEVSLPANRSRFLFLHLKPMNRLKPNDFDEDYRKQRLLVMNSQALEADLRKKKFKMFLVVDLRQEKIFCVVGPVFPTVELMGCLVFQFCLGGDIYFWFWLG